METILTYTSETLVIKDFFSMELKEAGLSKSG